jgi:phosphatidylglycerophosphatase A
MKPLLTKAIATFFGVGYIPFVPATWASAAAAVLGWFMGPWIFLGVAVSSIAGLLACAPARRVLGHADPPSFVMDEVAGMLLTLLWVPRTVPYYLAAFLLFRLFDAWKPWLIRRIQDSPRATSIMWDDLAAGVTAGVVLTLIGVAGIRL